MIETAEVPFIPIGNRRCLTGEQLAEFPWLSNFVERFPEAFEYDPSRSIWVLIEEMTE